MEKTTLRVALSAFALSVAACDAGAGEVPDTGAVDGAWRQAFDAAPVGWLLGVWAPPGSGAEVGDGASAREVIFAVGGTPEAGVIMRWNGGGWSEEPLSVSIPLLDAVHGFSADDALAVGDEGTILQWGGQAWVSQTSPTEQHLRGVWGAAPDDRWIVGGDPRPGGVATVLRWRGQRWEEVNVPTLSKSGVRSFFGVWGSGPDDVYIVGQSGAVLRWDGVTLAEQHVGVSEDLFAVWGTGSDHLVIVGGRDEARVVTWDGQVWRSEALASLPPLHGVWSRDADHIHVCGDGGGVATIDFETLTGTLEALDTHLDLRALFGDAGGRLTVVGGSVTRGGSPYEGAAYQRGLSEGE